MRVTQKPAFQEKQPPTPGEPVLCTHACMHVYTHTRTRTCSYSQGSVPAAGMGIFSPFFSGVSSRTPRAEVHPEALLTAWTLVLSVRGL